MLNQLSKRIYENNKEKGFWDNNRQRPECLMLIVSELSEALEADRKGKEADLEAFENALIMRVDKKQSFLEHVKDTFQDELTDALIRILDLCGHEGIDIDSHIALKLEYNKTRPHKHGKKF